MTVTSVNLNYAYYWVVGDIVHFAVSAIFTIGGSVNTTVNVILPIQSNPSLFPGLASFNCSVFYGAGPTMGGGAFTEYGTSTILVRNQAGVNWVSGNNRTLHVSGFYRKD